MEFAGSGTPLTQKQQVIGLLGIAVLVLATVIFFTRKRPLPGKLKPKGTFEHEDPGSSDAKAERRRDFARILATKRDILVFTSTVRQLGTVLPGDLGQGDLNDMATAEKVASNKLKFWIQMELGSIPGAIDLGMTSEWSVVERVVHAISVSPGFDFVMRHGVPPMIMQAKFILMISKGGQVRVAWVAFVTDNPQPGMTAGPFVLKLVSEDLRGGRERTWTHFKYTVKAASSSDIERIVASYVPQILKGVDSDKWDAFEQA